MIVNRFMVFDQHGNHREVAEISETNDRVSSEVFSKFGIIIGVFRDEFLVLSLQKGVKGRRSRRLYAIDDIFDPHEGL